MARAIILLSGGIDSTVVLALALSQGVECLAISFDYGQRHRIELQSARAIASHYKVPYQVITIDPAAFLSSSLIGNSQLPQGRTASEMAQGGIPSTYVPARNTLFLSYALGLCELHRAGEIHFGPNRLDEPCYPDCRPSYLAAFQQVMNLATKQAVEGEPPKLVTPLLKWDKGEIIRCGRGLNAPLKKTWSCYAPEQGKPCKACDACILREQGFRQAMLRDPQVV